MSDKALELVYQFEKSKEDQAANVLRQAQAHYQTNVDHLNGIGQYRLDYMKQLNERASSGVGGLTFGHYQNFIAKLDTAATQQQQTIIAAKKVVEQRRQQWIKQQQKVKSVEILLAKKRAKVVAAESKQEQKMFDEIAGQRFIRQQSTQ